MLSEIGTKSGVDIFRQKGNFLKETMFDNMSATYCALLNQCQTL